MTLVKFPLCILAAMVLAVLLLSGAAHAANGANFILYNHYTAETGEKEIMFMNDFGQEPDGTRYAAQMVEFELGVTDNITTGFMVEGQTTSGEGGYHVTGFRWENRFRPFRYGTFLNPVLYVEYESLGEDTKYLMEVSGREDAEEGVRIRPRERVLETRLILGHDFSEDLNAAFNWINESDLDTGVTAFGYAIGMNGVVAEGDHEGPEGHRGTMLGVEIFGGVGDTDKGVTIDSDVTQHYLGGSLMLHPSRKVMVKFGGAVGLTNVSQDLIRAAVGYEF